MHTWYMIRFCCLVRRVEVYAVYRVIFGDIVGAVVVARNLFRNFAVRKVVDMAVADTVVVVQKVTIVEVTEKLDDGGDVLCGID